MHSLLLGNDARLRSHQMLLENQLERKRCYDQKTYINIHIMYQILQEVVVMNELVLNEPKIN